jgi:hypothetical protein
MLHLKVSASGAIHYPHTLPPLKLRNLFSNFHLHLRDSVNVASLLLSYTAGVVIFMAATHAVEDCHQGLIMTALHNEKNRDKKYTHISCEAISLYLRILYRKRKHCTGGVQKMYKTRSRCLNSRKLRVRISYLRTTTLSHSFGTFLCPS